MKHAVKGQTRYNSYNHISLLDLEVKQKLSFGSIWCLVVQNWSIDHFRSVVQRFSLKRIHSYSSIAVYDVLQINYSAKVTELEFEVMRCTLVSIVHLSVLLKL